MAICAKATVVESATAAAVAARSLIIDGFPRCGEQSFMQHRFRADIGCQNSLLCLPRDRPSSTNFRTGRLLAPPYAMSQSVHSGM
jgi:hypothetical protein